MQSNLKALLERLLRYKIDFVLAGGLASAVHGSPQVTQDIDICIAITEEEVAKLREALKDLNPRHRMNPSFKPSFLEYPEKVEGWNNIYLETDLGVLDILSELKPVGSFARINANAITISVYGYDCKVISIDDLLTIKASMTRPKDKETVRILTEIKARTEKPGR